MKTLEDHLAAYAACHRDARNIATHCIGIPLIVAAVAILLSRPVLSGGSPATVATLLAALYYLRLDLRLGLAMSVALGLAAALGAWAAAHATAFWLALGVGGFVTGWAFQLVGHLWEGRKPAFVDDLASLLIGPLFIAAETAFALGLRLSLRQAIESRAGPVRGGRAPR